MTSTVFVIIGGGRSSGRETAAREALCNRQATEKLGQVLTLTAVLERLTPSHRRDVREVMSEGDTWGCRLSVVTGCL
jgi:chorismate synthase